MKHFGGIANVGRSHIQTMCTLARILVKRGHRFTFFGTARQVQQAAQYEVDCILLGPEDPADESNVRTEREQTIKPLSQLAYMKEMAALLCREAPRAVRRKQIDVLLADQDEPGAATTADLAGIPYITISSAVPLNEDKWVPPSFLPWPAPSGFLGRARISFSYRIRNVGVSGVHRIINRYRRAARLPGYRRPDDSFSRIAQISQLVKEIDFIREREDPRLRYVGPFQRHGRLEIPFPFERLDARPLVYASFGTVPCDVTPYLQSIAEACAALPVQLAISLGGAELREAHSRFPGNPIVVAFAPQLELLSRSAVFITHAGLNSVMEGLSMGVPLIAFPQQGDQFGMGARIAHHGAGRVFHSKSFTAAAVREAIMCVTQDPRYKASADRIQRAIARTGGASEAVDIIESLSLQLQTGAADQH